MFLILFFLSHFCVRMSCYISSLCGMYFISFTAVWCQCINLSLMLALLLCHCQCDVSVIILSLSVWCQCYYSVTVSVMSVLLLCHCQCDVSVISPSLSVWCQCYYSVTVNVMSGLLFCHCTVMSFYHCQCAGNWRQPSNVFVCARVEESYEDVEMKHVDIQNGEGVYVTWVGDPSDFRVHTIPHVGVPRRQPHHRQA